MSLVGQQLGEFEILERLGEGGMGTVYKARQISLDRLVALKTLQTSLAEDATYIARFRQEAKAAALLSHPNLVQVYAAGESQGVHWFAMEYVEGESARERLLRKGRLDPIEAVAIASHVATALDYGWRKAGLIHRDIKPDNIFLSEGGEVKLGDLGMAKSVEQTQGLTMTGSSMGTPSYMSPEQVEARKDVDLRTDIYSLGCTLYHLLSGRPPFTANSAAAVMMKHVMAPTPELRGVWPECPAELSAAVRKTMQKQPARRQQSYEEVSADLRRAHHALTGESMPAAIAVTRRPGVVESKPATATARGAAKVAAWVTLATAVCAAAWALLYFGPWKSGSAARHSASPAAAQAPAGSGEALLSDATRNKPFVNTLGMKFVPVPIVGGPTGGQRVLVSVWLTRVQDYEIFATETKRAWPKPNFAQSPTDPAIKVSWGDATLFCQWLTNREQAAGRLPAGWSYRLPSDHEWSCAVGIGGKEDAAMVPAEKSRKIDGFPWGGQWPPPAGAGNYAGEELRPGLAAGKQPSVKGVIGGYHDGFVNTSPAGSFAANRFGLFDLGGNVWEWCEDWNDQNRRLRVLRGASWDNCEREMLLSSFRLPSGPENQSFSDGFRCVVGVAAPPPAAESSALPATAAATPQPEANGRGGTIAPAQSRPAPPAAPPPQPSPPSATAKWLAEQEPGWQDAFANEVSKPFEKGVRDLKKQYLDTLAAKLAAATHGNQLEAAVAYRAEEKFVEGADVAEADGPADGAALKALRAAYRKSFAALEAARLAKAKIIHARTDATLAQNQALLTTRQRLDEALEIKARRDQLAAAWLKPPTSPLGHALAAAAKEQPFVNTLEMKFVPAPIMGGPTGGQRVLFSVWLTRVQDYEVFAKETKREWPATDFVQGPAHPAVNVSWEDARSFCEWLTAREHAAGRLPAEWRYRLPSDHEWSCAGGIGAREDPVKQPGDKRLGIKDAYPWGTPWPPPAGAGNYAGEELRPALAAGKYSYVKNVVAGYNDGFVNTSPVGSFPANRLGLFDLGGNAWEWCEDWSGNEQKCRVLRGGGWDTFYQVEFLLSMRIWYLPSRRHPDFGFRCVADAAAPSVPEAPAPQAAKPATPAPASAAAAGATVTNNEPAEGARIAPSKAIFRNLHGKSVELFEWKGARCAVYTISGGLDRRLMGNLVNTLDKICQFYATVGAREPEKDEASGNRAVVMEDESIPRDTYADFGRAVIRMSPETMRKLQAGAAQGEKYEGELFWGLGNNTWFYQKQLNPEGADYGEAFRNGYTRFMALAATKSLGLKLQAGGGLIGEESRDRVEALADTYAAGAGFNFANTIGANKIAQDPGSLDGADLFASFCLRLCRDNGGTAFARKLSREVLLRPEARTPQDGIDNFILAACAAAGKNLSGLFSNEWRWPMSDKAMKQAASRWGAPELGSAAPSKTEAHDAVH